MTLPAREQKQAYSFPVLAYGGVIGEDKDIYLVKTDRGGTRARRAAGCLLAPRPGDTVLMSLDEAGTCFILSVLTRGGTGPNELAFDGQVDLRVRNGGMSIAADRKLSLTSEEELSCASGNMTLSADRGQVRFQRLSIIGGTLKGQIGRIKLVAEKVEHVFGELTQHLTNAFRFVSKHEEIQTRSSRQLVEDTYLVHAKYAEHMAEEIVRINAGQIHLG